MGKSLVIVESKAKASTINKFLGRGFTVKASIGHVRDLPKKKLAIDIDNGFEPTYVTIRGKGKVLKELKEAAKKAETVYLASDFDREGEAIAWHITQTLKLPDDKYRRVVFNEITKKAILDAMEHPGEIDMRKVDAQQARRVLDRLVGYKVSPVLWKTIYYGLSAGRVQSVALRLICEREDEIDAFEPEEFWTVDAVFTTDGGDEIEARLDKVGGKKAKIRTGDEANGIVRAVEGGPFAVSALKKRERKVNPLPPFITSTLQRDAANRLRFTSKRTMVVAQQLYEGLPIGGENVGLITYMRTDSTRMAASAIEEAREHLREAFGARYVEKKPRRYRAKKGAQDAHEAIRPTSVERTPESLKPHLTTDQFRLYELIWRRFVATQMPQALYENTTVTISADGHDFKATGSVVRFPGWTAVYKAAWKDQKELPPLSEGQRLALSSITPNQRFTKPPARYSEATLIKELEAKGIGRPSTYASIVDTLKKRKYVALEKRQFAPTELGRTVWDLLKNGFPDIFDVAFTAEMEEELDKVESGEDDWVSVVSDFYGPFSKRLGEVEGKIADLKQSLIKETEKRCERCGSVMVEKWGRNGRFLACSSYPECKFTMPVEDEEVEEFDVKCEECGRPMVVKHGRYGKFLGCSGYPECKNTAPLPTGVACPQEDCDGVLVQRRTKRGRTFYGCSAYPKCEYAIWDKPVPIACPACQAGFMVEKGKKGDKKLVCLECGERVSPDEAKSSPGEDEV
ncbi:MAG: type I DNA topoisomerase [Candidatus Eisenbacteria bacterium]|nr:type I DNA topoisomerase [Candidatus Eisenbacteria bacterium]